jgi:peroxiredoxin
MSTPFILSYVLLWAVVVLQSMLLLGMLRVIQNLQQGHAQEHGGADEPAAEPTAERLIGQEIPAFAAVDIFGASFGSEQLRGRSTVVLFASPNCASCLLALEELNTVGRKANGNVVVVCGGRQDACRRMAQDFSLTVPVILDPDDEIQRLFDVAANPTAVLLNPNNRVVSYGHPVRGDEIGQMMNGEAAAAAR